MTVSKPIDPILTLKHYSTKLFQVYLKMLQKKLGRDQTLKLIEKTGVTWDYLESNSNWVSDEFANRFYTAISEEPLLDDSFSYEVGCMILTREMSGLVTLVGMQLSSPTVVFTGFKWFTDQYNKLDSIDVTRAYSKNFQKTVEIKFKSKRKTAHIKKIAQEWQGAFEGIPAAFNLQKGTCKYKIIDGQFIEFIVQWNELSYYILIGKIYIISVIFSIILFLFIFAFIVFKHNYEYLSLINSFILTLAILCQQKLNLIRKKSGENKDLLSKTLEEESARYDELLSNQIQLERRYQEARLIYDVINRLTLTQDAKELVQITVEEIKERLKYDRVIFLKHNKIENSLEVHAHSGFEKKLALVINNYKADLNLETSDPNHIGNVYKQKKNIIVNVNSEYLESLVTSDGKAMIQLLGSKSFLICTVVGYGIILVDYIQPDKKLDKEDLYFITFISKELSICFDNVAAAEKERFIRSTFQQFVPREVIEAALGEANNNLNEGEPRFMSVLMCDIRGFTNLSERAQIEGWSVNLLAALNYYLDTMGEIIYKNGGIIDKYGGDSIIATFNVFGNLPEHKIKAIETAYQMIQSIPKVNLHIKDVIFKDYPSSLEFFVGIGVNCGYGIVGNIGSARKKEFTVIGDVVNTAARIEGETKLCFNGILISSEMNKVASNYFFTEAYGSPKILKGKLGTHVLYLLKEMKNGFITQI